MRAVLQRVSSASVTVGGKTIAEIGQGLLALVAIARADSPATLAPFVEKVTNLRMFSDAAGHFSRSLAETANELLLVSQFTLFADIRRGRRPDFSAAAPADVASALFAELAERFQARGVRTQTGQFGADMQVALVNDGPVTLIVDM